MTGKEMIKLADKARQITSEITGKNFRERIKELYAIAIENGHSTKFGWLEEPIEYPNEYDFETEDEYDEAYERYEEFRNSCVGFVWADEHNFIPYGGYSFVIDKQGNVIFTSVENLTNEEKIEFEDDVRVMFIPWLVDNWKACVEIISQIERELAIE